MITEIDKMIAKNVKEIRKQKGKTQDDVAKYLDVSTPYICLLEKSKKRFTGAMLYRLSLFFKVNVNRFFKK